MQWITADPSLTIGSSEGQNMLDIAPRPQRDG